MKEIKEPDTKFWDLYSASLVHRSHDQTTVLQLLIKHTACGNDVSSPEGSLKLKKCQKS
ncbi:uncharacterized protein PHALS_14201 [Plasmopara halstedii]|uniref:Uncharacterized protein n=1 Tax=Plasmopara halstedii TaxID=4781 RepID=A0A0P1AT49_PLAHL|nr:uncharacterized protein PHALS_14201 [Plasmopara halstedii]CEG43919.1 hypothetical protein PHALS_14201 [Plasmopara halstedii]|eukprot:XP_024580288.1 hypothetical protein PHALS_14201 [Plasmopara halstedii]